MPSARRNTPKDSLAGAASDRVRAIIEAAETSAEAIRAEAEEEADRIRVRAEERARALRSEVRSDVQGLIASIQEGVDRLRADLERLERRLSEPEPGSVSADPGSAEPVPIMPAPGSEVELEPELALAEDAAVTAAEPGSSPVRDLEGARLVALNMALDGAPREEVDRHLRDRHGVSDPGALLDEVYESIDRS